MPNTAYNNSNTITNSGWQIKNKVQPKRLGQKGVLQGLTVVIFSGMLLLTGCATKPTYQTRGPNVLVDSRGVPNFYKVQSGDTVSQIAARYGLNYRQLGALNHLDNKYTIYAGQWLKLWEGRGGSPVNARNNTHGAVTAQNKRTTPSTTPAPTVPVKPSYNASVSSTKGYRYPTSNQVIKNFDANAGNMSMWFGGRLGDPVLASREGQVLYAGDGLPEYGNLIMIRHDATYITVYAHNNELLVQEGDQVQAGQRIATMGSTGQTNQVALQFQVRENGTPIDPRAVLGL